MLVTLNAHCPQCRITHEKQVDEDRIQSDSEGNQRVRCYRCGGMAHVSKPKRHDHPNPTPDTTPHHEKSPVGGY